MAAAVNLVGSKFGNGWEAKVKLTCAQYRDIYIKETGDTSKQIKNSHYLCHNHECGVDTYMESTTIQRAIRSGTPCMSKCKGCSKDKAKCFYATACREKNLTKIPDRTKKVNIGDVIGLWTVVDISDSGANSDHQCRAHCTCNLCGAKKAVRFDHLSDLDAACECFKSRSSGEMLVKQCLDKLPLSYQSEYTFPDLVGTGGGALRYDYAIFDFNKKVIGLVEFDGAQHFQEAGSYFNPTGKVQEHDAMKNVYAHMHNIPLLRIPYDKASQVENLLIDFIKKI